MHADQPTAFLLDHHPIGQAGSLPHSELSQNRAPTRDDGAAAFGGSDREVATDHVGAVLHDSQSQSAALSRLLREANPIVLHGQSQEAVIHSQTDLNLPGIRVFHGVINARCCVLTICDTLNRTSFAGLGGKILKRDTKTLFEEVYRIERTRDFPRLFDGIPHQTDGRSGVS